MKNWTEWEVIRHRVSLGGVVTCDDQPLVTALAEVASAPNKVLEDDGAQGGEFGDENDQRHGFQPAGTKLNGYFFVLDLIPGTYVLRVSNPARSKKWTLFTVKIPGKGVEGASMTWKSIDIPRSP